MISGQDIVAHMNLHSAVFPRALKEKGEGRFLTLETSASRTSSSAARSRVIFPTRREIRGRSATPCGSPTTNYTIVGLYETGSMLLDVVIVMDIETGTSILNFAKDSISSIYVEAKNPGE